MSGLDEVAARARETRIAVVGGGMAGMAAALECAKVGLSVTLFEASDRLGGTVRSAEVGGVRVDVGAESYATRGGAVRALVEELGLGDAIVTPAAGRAWVAGLDGSKGGTDAAPLPAGGVLGIPSNPWDPDVVRIIGTRGAWRAYLDRLRPLLTIGSEHSLGRLVRTRMGDRVLDRLVAPVTTGVYSARPDDIDVDVAAPGLNAALTRVGSLTGAVAALRMPGKAPGAAVEGIDGGMSRLADALRERLVAYDVRIRTGVAVTALTPDGDRWFLDVDDASAADAAGPSAGTAFDHVIVAAPETVARRLLAPHTDLDDEAPVAPVVEIVTLVVDAPALDTPPRGTGVLTVPGTYRAKALTHSTAKWAWLARDVAGSAGRTHVLRVSFGAQDEAPATESLDDAQAAALALAEASALLGLGDGELRLLDSRRDRFVQSQPAAVIGRAELAASARAAVAAVAGLGVAGAWIAGTGLAQVIPDAVKEADRVRDGALWVRSDPAE